jgi:N-acetylglutamate synthase-like GNAT family acetyltransferase
MNDHAHLSAGPFVIRAAGPADTDAVSILLEASYSRLLVTSYDRNILRRALPYMIKSNPALLASGTYYVAETEPGVLVGCGGWTAAKPGSGEMTAGEAHIRHFAIHPDWTRRGIGSSLLDRCIRDARSLGIVKLHCFSTLNAEPFYRASGFDTIGSIGVPMGPTITFPAVLMLQLLRRCE